MLWLHFGMPKTGTTALQSFLSDNHGALQGSGLLFMEAGRRLPTNPRRIATSHNQIFFDLVKGWPNFEFYRDAILEEYKNRPVENCVISSEMFFSARHEELAQLFKAIPRDEIRILFYCRRYDDYFEAEYKQSAKNGKISADATRHITARLAEFRQAPERFNLSGRVAMIRKAFPGVEIRPVIYDRDTLENGNMIDDFLKQTGATCPEGLTTALNSNSSLSRIASEAFGIATNILGRKASRKHRRVISDEPSLQRKNDVLEIGERMFLNEWFAQTDDAFRQEFFPDRNSLFPDRAPSDEMRDYKRDTPKDISDMKHAMSLILRTVVDQGASAPQARRGKRAASAATEAKPTA